MYVQTEAGANTGVLLHKRKRALQDRKSQFCLTLLPRCQWVWRAMIACKAGPGPASEGSILAKAWGGHSAQCVQYCVLQRQCTKDPGGQTGRQGQP